MEPPGGIGRLTLRALVRRDAMRTKGIYVPECVGCDGRPESHDEELRAQVRIRVDPEEWAEGLSLWPGGERAPWCICEMCRSPFVAYVAAAARWAANDQPIGAFVDLPEAVTEAVVTIRSEWATIQREEST